MALDWISGNWYFLDDNRDMIFICTQMMKHCMILIDVNLSKPRGIALDPTKGCVQLNNFGVLHLTSLEFLLPVAVVCKISKRDLLFRT